MWTISMNARKARVIMLILVTVAVVNIIINSLLSGNSAKASQPLEQRNRLDRNDHGNGLWNIAAMSKKDLTALLQVNHTLPSGCRDKDIFTITFVISEPNDISRRNAIRNSWATANTVENKSVLTIFVVGEHPHSRNPDDVIRFNEEVAKYGDILKGTFKDEREARNSLTLLLGIQWMQDHCQRVSYILVVNDNMFVNYRRLVKVLKHRGNQGNDAKLWMGNMRRDQIPIRNPASPQYIYGKQFNESIYPPFCISSAGYVMKIAAARDLYNSSLTYGLFLFLDVLTGLVARDHNWTLINNDQLFTTMRMRSKPCSVDRVVTAVASDNPDSMIAIVKQISNLTVLQNCIDPDLELVLPMDINNKPYLDKVLQLHLDHPDACFHSGRKKRHIFMVAFINSHPEDLEIRKAIRKTWSSDRSIDGEFIKVFFILGKQTPLINQSSVMAEDAQFQDILQGDFVDSFANLTLKVITGLKWVNNNCAHARYFYKGDADVFVNFKSIVRYLKKLRSSGEVRERLYLGSRIYGNERLSIKRENRANIKKLQVPDKLYSGRYYPAYCSGRGYILSTDVVPAMYRASLGIPLIGVADAFQGILAKRLDVEPVGHPCFKTWGGRVDACSLRSNDTLTVHGVTKTAEQIYRVWETYTDKSINCSDVWDRL